MLKHVLKDVPEIDKSALILSGATEIRKVFSSAEIPFVVEGYMTGLKVVFAICIACTGLATLISLGTRWKKLQPENLAQAGGAA